MKYDNNGGKAVKTGDFTTKFGAGNEGMTEYKAVRKMPDYSKSGNTKAGTCCPMMNDLKPDTTVPGKMVKKSY